MRKSHEQRVIRNAYKFKFIALAILQCFSDKTFKYSITFKTEVLHFVSNVQMIKHTFYCEIG